MDERPALAAGVELVGELRGSGYRETQRLVRRADGQTFQLTPLLYAVLAAVDGARTPLQVAWEVARSTGRVLSADEVRYLLEEKLRPMGVLRRPDGAEPHVTRSSPLLGLRLKKVVTSPRLTDLLTAPVSWLFHPFLVGAVVVGFVATNAWVLLERGLGSALGDAIYQPSSVLLLVVLTVASAAFHELGHAAACRYGGARPGAMGAALYLVWPVFYTDVTDSYRLPRGGRLRVDLGGVYFNAVFTLATFGLWWSVRSEPLLLLVPVQLFQMLRQLVPLVRFDGYHILADLLGVPDLFARIRPTLAGLLPSNWGRAESKVLRPVARLVVTAWVLVVVPALAAFFVAIGMALPRAALTAWDSFGVHAGRLRLAFSSGDIAGVALIAVALLMLLLPPLSMAYVVTSIGRRLTRLIWSRAEGRPALQGAFAVSGLALLLMAGSAVWPDRPYVPTNDEAARPVPRDGFALLPSTPDDVDRADYGVPAELPATDADGNLRERRLVVVRTAASSPPDAGVDGAHVEPTPTEGTSPLAASRPSWPFPFAAPGPVGEGDNRALAVNTVDGSSITDMSVAMVWLSDEEIAHINAAYAFASCHDCSTTAAAFHVIFARGTVSSAIPQNLAVAYNQECDGCDTTAVAMQLVVTLVTDPSPEAMAAIEAEWDQVKALEAQADRGELTPAEIQQRMASHRDALLSIVAPFAQLASGEPPADAATDAAGDAGGTEPVADGATSDTTSGSSTSTSSSTTTTSTPESTSSTTTTTTTPSSTTTTTTTPSSTTTTSTPESTSSTTTTTSTTTTSTPESTSSTTTSSTTTSTTSTTSTTAPAP